MLNLVFLGPPGAGKGTQAQAVAQRFEVPHISTGDIIRATMRQESSLGAELRRYTEAGLLVPDALVDRMVEDRLAQADCERGFLLDGYPRTLEQAQALDQMLARRGQTLSHVVFFDVPDDVLLERITGRRSDPETGRVYHLKFDPPPPALKARLMQRSDDTEEVFGKRLTEYRAKTAPLIPYYERAKLLRRIDATSAIDAVERSLFEALA